MWTIDHLSASAFYTQYKNRVPNAAYLKMLTFRIGGRFSVIQEMNSQKVVRQVLKYENEIQYSHALAHKRQQRCGRDKFKSHVKIRCTMFDTR